MSRSNFKILKSTIALNISGITKNYFIGKVKDSSLRKTITALFNSSNSKEKYIALNDISFKISKGEVVGVIGKNGAGKSTLLKILSQITKPTEGRIEINGRIASLLEVGTGFHPELTGRENIYLNGTILGMTRKEVKAKFDEIVEFSGVEKFIDTPVKHYSSGMYVRLAFAVAAHLDPEILIIDEVLAVGDAEFQKKCMGKMQEVAGEGRTVIFVSHNMGAISNLCTRCIYLKNGQLVQQGNTKEIIDLYLSDNIIKSTKLGDILIRQGNGNVKFQHAFWKTKNSQIENNVESLKPCELHIFLNHKVNLKETRIDVGINDSQGTRIAWLSSKMIVTEIKFTNTIIFNISNFNLAPGEYSCNFFCEINLEINDWLKNVLPFSVPELDYYRSGKTVPSNQGNLLFKYEILT